MKFPTITEGHYHEELNFFILLCEICLKEQGRPVKYFPTSKGIIIYAKDGSMHIWPSDPGAIIK